MSSREFFNQVARKNARGTSVGVARVHFTRPIEFSSRARYTAAHTARVNERRSYTVKLKSVHVRARDSTSSSRSGIECTFVLVCACIYIYIYVCMNVYMYVYV